MDTLKDVNYSQLIELYKNHKLVVALAHTPTCGTCVLAKKMLFIIGETLKHVPIVKINLNYHSEFAQNEEILSVPCILIFDKGFCVEKIYAIDSVPHLYKKITSYL